MLKQLKNNEKGVVFVTVLMIIIVMMVLAVSITSMNVSQVKISESEVQRIQAEMLAIGALALTYANQQSSTPGPSIAFNETLDGIPYQVVSNLDGSSSGLFNTENLNIVVNY